MNSLGRGSLASRRGGSQPRRVQTLVAGKKTKTKGTRSQKSQNVVKKRGKGRKTGSSRPSTLTPARRSVWLEYVSIINYSSGAGVTGFAYPFQVNGAYEPDPAVPGAFPTTPGFATLARNYSYYRVKRYKGEVTFISSGWPQAASVVCHSNSLLGTAAGGTNTIDLLQFAANRPSVNTIKPLPPQSAGNISRATHRFSHSVEFITGESVMLPGYKALTNAVPASPCYMVVGIQSSNANNTSATIELKLKMLVEYLTYIDTLTTVSDQPVTELGRIASLGKPVVAPPCAGCFQVQLLPFEPCPDPKCHCLDRCLNCGYERRCSRNCQSSKCPFRTDTIPICPPFVSIDLKDKQLSKV